LLKIWALNIICLKTAMTTITLKINERTTTGKEIKKMILALLNVPDVEITSEDSEVYSDAFVKKINKARVEKGGIVVHPDNLWENIKNKT
jgi:hypothetical protein